ncbi:MAG TPA: type VI secretion system-associated protein TagF, partial [Roseiarcus sp.]
MPAGLFGKLPAKRDFVAAKAPRRFLEVWEPWLQGSVATARQTLGATWLDVYNRAPIWRFWFGADFCGEATIGVFAPSIDGVGRLFPLTIFAGEGEASLPPPEIDANDFWCEAAEAILLDALDPEVSFETIAARVAALPAPALQPRSGDASGIEQLPEGGVLVRDIDRQVSLAFRAARRFGHRDAFAAQS